MDDAKYETAMQIIMHGGNAKSLALMAIDAANEGNLEEAQAHLDEAQREITEAHKMQFAMIQQEAAGTPVEVNIVLVHAQDHLTMALIAADLAQRFIDMDRRLAAAGIPCVEP